MYRQGLAAQQGGAGIAEIGGIWSGYDGNGSWSPLAQQNGQLGYYVDSYTDWYSSTGAYMDTQYNGTRFEPLKVQTQTGPLPEWHVLYRSLETDIFGHKITYSDETRTVEVKTVVRVDFNSSGKKVINMSGFRITNTIIEGKSASEWKALPRNINDQLILPNGMGQYIKTLETFWREETVWDKYWNFILSPQDRPKTTNKFGTGTHR
jgi:hypothetical protein